MLRRSFWILPLALSLMAMGTTDSCSDDPSPGVQGTVQIVAGNGQTGPAGGALANTLRVRIVGTSGKAIVGQSVHWIVATGGGSVSAEYTGTELQGIGEGGDAWAEVAWTLGQESGAQTLLATVDDLEPADTLLFTATATGGTSHPMAAISAYNGSEAGGVQVTMQTPFDGTQTYGPLGASVQQSRNLRVEVGAIFSISATQGQLTGSVACRTTAGIIPDTQNPQSGSALVAVFPGETGGLVLTCNGNWQVAPN